MKKRASRRGGWRRVKKKPCEGYYLWIKSPSESFPQYSGYSPGRGGNSALPYFPLTTDLYVFHPVLPQSVECLPFIRRQLCALLPLLKPRRPPNHGPEGRDAPRWKPKSRPIRDPLWPLYPCRTTQDIPNHRRRQPDPGPLTFESRLPELADPAGPLGVRSLI